MDCSSRIFLRKNSLLKVTIFLTLCQINFALDNLAYTKLAYTKDFNECITDCLNGECIIDWNRKRDICFTFNVTAPMYRTTQRRDNDEYCLSKCGRFGYSYEWCFTSHEGEWDYCSSFTMIFDSKISNNQKQIKIRTSSGHFCIDECAKRDTTYYWCHYDSTNDTLTDNCALPVIMYQSLSKPNCNDENKLKESPPNNFTIDVRNKE